MGRAKSVVEPEVKASPPEKALSKPDQQAAARKRRSSVRQRKLDYHTDKLEVVKAAHADYLNTNFSTHEHLGHQIWMQLFFLGTELDHYDEIYAHPWLFPELGEDASQGGELYDMLLTGRRVKLFGVVEPKNIDGRLYLVPIVCAVSADIDIPALVGVKSVQKETEDVLPFEQMHLSYKHIVVGPPGARKRSRQIYLECLTWDRRLDSRKNLTVHEANLYQYGNVYLFNPKEAKADLASRSPPEDAEVDVTLDGKTTHTIYGEYDDLKQYAVETILRNFMPEGTVEDAIPPRSLQSVMKQFQAALESTKKAFKEYRSMIKEKIDSCTPEYVAGIEGMKMIKYYPYLEYENISMTTNTLINRFFGRATSVKGGTNPYPD